MPINDPNSKTAMLFALTKQAAVIDERVQNVQSDIREVKSSIDKQTEWNFKQDESINKLNEIKTEVKTAWKLADWIKSSGLGAILIALYHLLTKAGGSPPHQP